MCGLSTRIRLLSKPRTYPLSLAFLTASSNSLSPGIASTYAYRICLPLLAACKRFAHWTNKTSAAIWSATVAPRIALNKGETVQDFLVGKSLNQLLRWTLDMDSEELTWNHAK